MSLQVMDTCDDDTILNVFRAIIHGLKILLLFKLVLLVKMETARNNCLTLWRLFESTTNSCSFAWTHIMMMANLTSVTICHYFGFNF